MTNGPAGSVVERAVRRAGRAPSLHNSQPWLWKSHDRVLSLFAVPERMLPTTDPGGRQLLISCGAVLDHLRVAMSAAGWQLSVARLPNPNDRNHLADITFHRSVIVTEGDRARAEAIDRRYTDRLPFPEPSGWPDFETILRSTFDSYDAALDVLPEESRPALAHAAQMVTALRRYDADYHAELHWWTGHVISATGIPRSALAAPGEQDRVAVGRRFPSSESGASDRELEAADDHARILVLSTVGDTPEEIVRCGEVLSTVLLESTLAGYATCPLTNLTEVDRSRAVVRSLIGGDRRPQVLVRVGAVPPREQPPARTPRLPLIEILHTAAPSA
ncbi:Acg family FMN-binding oxidoreductase [Nocardia sp. NPDC003963]